MPRRRRRDDRIIPTPLAGDSSVEQLADLIAKTMPEDKDVKCSGDDAREGRGVHHRRLLFAQTRSCADKPARIELSRLTVRQYQNAVADLIGRFRRRQPSGATERGLRGEYYELAQLRRGERLHRAGRSRGEVRLRRRPAPVPRRSSPRVLDPLGRLGARAGDRRVRVRRPHRARRAAVGQRRRRRR